MPLPDPFPADEVAIALDPSQLAEPMLAHLAGLLRNPSWGNGLPRANILRQLGGEYDTDLMLALAEAWSWLERSGLIVPRPFNPQPEVYTLSRAARELGSFEEFELLRQAIAVPRSMLHPRIATKAWAIFITGDLDTAVFAAFKAVEIEVAKKSGSSETGVKLIRTAFDKKSGMLSDQSLPEAEREGVAHLFAGAFATFRNPAGHRDVVYSTAQEAAEQLVIASHLMRIVDSASA